MASQIYPCIICWGIHQTKWNPDPFIKALWNDEYYVFSAGWVKVKVMVSFALIQKSKRLKN